MPDARSGFARHGVLAVPGLLEPIMDEVIKAKQRGTAASASRAITIRGAREHNLKNVDLEVPRDKLVVFTGLSGSGKSSLAFATIYAEGQRRYVESLSAYVWFFFSLLVLSVVVLFVG